MKYRFRLPVIMATLMVVLLSQTGCKENTLINSQVSPSDNKLGVYDTSLSCITHTYYDDTAVTSVYISGLATYQGVGSMVDPFFGTLTAATHFQVVPVNASNAVYTDKTIDSAVIVLPYSGFSYGDTADQNAAISYQAFFMNELLGANSVIYSYETKQIDAVRPLSEPKSVNIYRLKDSIEVAGKKYQPGVRMKLNLSVLLSRLQPALTAATNAPATANTAFLDVFKGVCVKVADARQVTSAVPYFRMDGNTDYSSAGIIVYYHSNSGPADTLTQRYFFNGENCGFYNKVSRSYGRYPVSNLYNSTQPNDSIIALQNQPGAYLDIVIPGISSLPSGVINKAELQLTLLPAYMNNFEAPDRIFPRIVSNGRYPEGTSAGGRYNIADAYPLTSITPFAILGGKLSEDLRSGVTVKTYNIGIPREVMRSRAYGNDTIHLNLRNVISGTQDFIGAYRMIAAGGNHPNPIYRAKLFVVYSSLK